MGRVDPRILIAVFAFLLVFLAVWMDCEGQTFDGAVRFEKGYQYDNQQVIDYYTRNIKNIVSVNGKTNITIPDKVQAVTSQVFIVDGVPIQYKETAKGVTILDVPIQAKVVDFKTEKVSVVSLNSDAMFRPPAYAQLIADKIQEDVTAVGVVVKPAPIDVKPIEEPIEEVKP